MPLYRDENFAVVDWVVPRPRILLICSSTHDLESLIVILEMNSARSTNSNVVECIGVVAIVGTAQEIVSV